MDRFNFGGIEFRQNDEGDWQFYDSEDETWYLVQDIAFGSHWFLQTLAEGEIPQ